MAVLDEPSALTRVLARDVRPAIELVDGLRESGVDRDVAVPQMCVVGDQSSGKSSVLDAICGVPLPRGAGLTTRCAVELHLSDGRRTLSDPGGGPPLSPMQDHEDASSGRSWRASIATSVNPTPVPVQSLAALGSAIADLTAQLTDDRRSNGFSKERLIIHMVGPDLPNLTLIDLPGIIRTKTFNMPFIDVNNTAMADVRELIQSYMRQERTIILVVVPCTQDVATNEALEWAARFDPAGERTIGVMTKPDLIDPGAELEVLKVLTNQQKPLALGYIMLRNRNQREVAENLPSSEARRREAAFFDSSPVFSKIDRNLLGAEKLTQKLTAVLVSRIYAALPSMRNEILRKLERTNAELKEIGEGAGETEAEANMTLMRLVFEYHSLLQDTSNGRYVDKRLWDPKVRLCTRAQNMYDTFKSDVAQTRPDFESAVVKEVAEEIRRSRGRELPGFLNPRIFESRVAVFVEDWRVASNRLVNSTRHVLSDVTNDLFNAVAPEFPGLRLRVRDITASAIGELDRRARREIASVFAHESEAFTMNDQFLEAVNRRRLERFDAAVMVALARAGRDARGQSREKEVATLLRGWYQEHYCASAAERVQADAEDMAVMLSVYWDVAARRFVDSHVMAIEGTMIRPLSQAVHAPLNSMVLQSGSGENGAEGEGSITQLLREDEVTVTKRRTLIERKRRLTKARDLVDRF